MPEKLVYVCAVFYRNNAIVSVWADGHTCLNDALELFKCGIVREIILSGDETHEDFWWRYNRQEE